MQAEHRPPSLFLRQKGPIGLSGRGLGQIAVSVLEKGVPFRLLARGISMYPFILDGDVITVHPLQGETLAVGQVVAFIEPESEKLVVHRVIGRREGRYLLKGDNVPHPDGYFSAAVIVGIVKKVERRGVSVSFGDRKGYCLPALFLLRIESFLLKCKCLVLRSTGQVTSRG